MDSGLPVSDFEEFIDAAHKTAKQILLSKRQLRGTDNITRQGLQGVVTRISEDKMSRVQKAVSDITLRAELIKRNVPRADIDRIVPDPIFNAEAQISLEDDLLDVANYCFIAIALLRGRWDK